MATLITTATKTASVIKTTKGSEKKWSEILSMNRRHELQLPIDIAKYRTKFRRRYNIYQRQQDQTERLWAHKHETWYKEDFIFRNHFLKQLKPITKRFKHIDSVSVEENDDHQNACRVLNDDEIEVLSLKQSSIQELPPIKQPIRRPTIQHFQSSPDNKLEVQQPKTVFSKLICPKMLKEYTPRLDSHHHGPFLDLAQRFLKQKPETIKKGVGHNDKKINQKQDLKKLFENEQKRTRLAVIKFGKQLEDDKMKENNSNDFDSNDDDDYY